MRPTDAVSDGRTACDRQQLETAHRLGEDRARDRDVSGPAHLIEHKGHSQCPEDIGGDGEAEDEQDLASCLQAATERKRQERGCCQGDQDRWQMVPKTSRYCIGTRQSALVNVT